jgi:DNA invertase Pin-like site-specific DNA recombinase
MSAEEQIAHLTTVASERGWTVVKVFTDRPATVKKDRRPGELALIDAIRSGDVGRVLIFGIDRVGRSLTDLVTFMEVCRTAGVSLWLDEQRLDTAGSNGLPLFDVTEMMAFHLRQTRRDRILRGQAAVRGLVRFGRPPIAEAKVEKARIALAAGKGVRQVARLAGISAASVSRLKNAVAVKASVTA